jgi:hypothetical protein
MATTRAGDLRDRVGFYMPTETDDGFGNTQIGFPSEPTIGPVAAQIVAKLGGEAVLQGRLAGTNFVNITVRASGDTKQVTTAWKARDERAEVDYNIRSIVDPHKGTPRQGRFIEMLCEQGVAQ